MLKKITYLVTLALAWSLFSAASFAAETLSVKVEQPKSPTNQNTFKLNFVAMDLNNNTITVRCFKKGPSDGSFSQFDGDKSLAAGGNSGYCQVSNSIINSEGTYQFYVTAISDHSVDSSIVSVDYKTTGPGTPTDYSKERISSCQYKIKFKTADDGGKTIKVVLYRSDSTSFNADSGTQVESRNVGSNTSVEIDNTIPICGRDYYYVVRAFDSAGNGSDIIGDKSVTINYTTTTSTTTSPSLAPAKIVNDGNVNQSTEDQTNNPENNPTASPEEINVTPSVLGTETNANPFWKNPIFLGGVLAVALGIYILIKRKQ